MPNRFRIVDIDNLSAKNLVINNLDVLITANPAFTPIILPAPATGSLVNKGVRSLNSSSIEITNTQNREIFLDGAIHNPSGETAISICGSVSDRVQSAATQITSASLDLVGSAGHIGTAAQPIQAIIAKGTGLIGTGVVGANAAGEIGMTLSDSNSTEPVDLRGVISSSGDILLDLGLKNVALIGPISTTKKIELKNVKTITDSNDRGPDIAGASMNVVSTVDLGTVGNLLETSLGAIEGTATGGIFLDNNIALTIGGVSSTLSGLTAGGAMK